MSGIQTRVFYNPILDKVASLTLVDSQTGTMVFLIGREFIPNIVERIDELTESHEFNAFCFHPGGNSSETVMFIVKRQQRAQCAFTDFSALVTDWIHEMS